MSWEEELAKAKIAQRGFGAPEKSELYSSSDEMGFQPSKVDLGGSNYASQIQSQGTSGEAAIIDAATKGGTAWLAGGPAAAGIAVAGSLLAQSMANKAQAEQAKRQRAMEIAQQQAQGEQRGYEQMLGAWGKALS